jgi:hypothetical protein
MVARTAFTQLRYSPLLLLAAILGMGLVFVVPPVSVAAGFLAWASAATDMACAALAGVGAVAWALMTLTYLPILAWYGVSLAYGPFLPASALLYTLMTADSAWRTWRGRGGAWKGRTYPMGAAGSTQADPRDVKGKTQTKTSPNSTVPVIDCIFL